MFSMLGIVLANNFVMMFIFWELVGVSSYLLIGHWFERDAAAEAAKKAFITNRIGDFGFMLGILMVWAATGSLFSPTSRARWRSSRNPGYLTVAALLVFCGAVGKSAQFPLHVWLPDAMEGPTPISALIHAATMVAAGVYMLVRVGFLHPGRAAGAHDHRLDRNHHRRHGRAHRDAAKRHQTHPRLLDPLAARLHGHGRRSRVGRGGDVPSVHARLLQGAALPRRRLDHRHAPSRAKHLEDGRTRRPVGNHLSHLHGRHARADRLPALQRVLQQGRDPRARLRKEPGDFLARAFHRVSDRVLHAAAGGGRLLRQAAQR